MSLHDNAKSVLPKAGKSMRVSGMGKWGKRQWSCPGKPAGCVGDAGRLGREARLNRQESEEGMVTGTKSNA